MKTKFLTIDEIHENDLFDPMWLIYQDYFNVDYQAFQKSMRLFDSYALFFTRSGRLIGFSGIRDGLTEHGNRTYRTVYMGHFSMRKDFRGKSLIPFALVKLFLDHHLKFRKGKLVVWGDAGTYRSYLVMAKGTKYFFPTPTNPRTNGPIRWSSSVKRLAPNAFRANLIPSGALSIPGFRLRRNRPTTSRIRTWKTPISITTRASIRATRTGMAWFSSAPRTWPTSGTI